MSDHSSILLTSDRLTKLYLEYFFEKYSDQTKAIGTNLIEGVLVDYCFLQIGMVVSRVSSVHGFEGTCEILQDKDRSVTNAWKYIRSNKSNIDNRKQSSLISSLSYDLSTLLLSFSTVRFKANVKNIILGDGNAYFFPYISTLWADDPSVQLWAPAFLFSVTDVVSYIHKLITRRNDTIRFFPVLVPSKLTQPTRSCLLKSTTDDDPNTPYLFRQLDKISLALIANTLHVSNQIKALGFNRCNAVGLLHGLRFPGLCGLGWALKQAQVPTFLLSHGSHTRQKYGTPDYIAGRYTANGLLTTTIPDIKLISHSIFSDRYLDSLGYIYDKVQRVSFPCPQSPKPKLHESRTIILHAGTYKRPGIRPHMYEDEILFIHGIIHLVSQLYGLQHELILWISVRTPSGSYVDQRLKQIASEHPNSVIYHRDSSFKQLLPAADIVVSQSSTTLEDALYAGKLAMSYGSTGYDHFSLENTNYVDYTELNEGLRTLSFRLNRHILQLSSPDLHGRQPLKSIIDQAFK